jgi:uncharacterized membrane protein (UPF0127 family)
MLHLPFPFERSAQLTIESGKKTIHLESELAASEIEIFQSAAYRAATDLPRPLVLLFDDPTQQQFSKQDLNIPLEQILIEAGTHKVVGIHPIVPNPAKGRFIQCFSGLQAVILALPGFAKKHRIQVQKTFVTIKTNKHA